MYNIGFLYYFGLVCPIGFDTSKFFFISDKVMMTFFLSETIFLYT